MGAKRMKITDQYRADASAVSLRMLTNTRLVVKTPSIVRVRQASSARQGLRNVSRRLTRFPWSSKAALAELRGRRASAPIVNLSLRKMRRGSSMTAVPYDLEQRRSSAPPKFTVHQRRMAMRAAAPPQGTQLGGRRRSSALHPTVTTIDRLSVYVQQWGTGSVQQCAARITRASETIRGATDSFRSHGGEASGSRRSGDELGTQCQRGEVQNPAKELDSMPKRRSSEPGAAVGNEGGRVAHVSGRAPSDFGRASPAQKRPPADKAQLRKSISNDDFNAQRCSPIPSEVTRRSMRDMMLLERQEVIGGGSYMAGIHGPTGSPSMVRGISSLTLPRSNDSLSLTGLDTPYSPPKVRGSGGAKSNKDMWSSARRSD